MADLQKRQTAIRLPNNECTKIGKRHGNFHRTVHTLDDICIHIYLHVKLNIILFGKVSLISRHLEHALFRLYSMAHAHTAARTECSERLALSISAVNSTVKQRRTQRRDEAFTNSRRHFRALTSASSHTHTHVPSHKEEQKNVS